MAKIPRKTQQVFASTSGATGITEFGSTAVGSTVYSTDLDVIQSTEFLQGWLGGVLAGTKRLPTYEDMNAVQYVQTTQLGYILQEGVAEYDSGTEYHQNSVVKKSGTYELWGSVINNNTGNPLVEGANWTLLSDLQTGTAHVGSYLDVASESVPTGYLECDGSAISRTTYANLFGVIGDQYGVGDGSITFNIPDWRGLFPRCWDNGAGVDPDAGSISGQSANTNTSTSITNAPDVSGYSERRYIGADITGTDIPSNTKIVNWVGTTITISQAATGTSAISDMAIDFDVVESKQSDEFKQHLHELGSRDSTAGLGTDTGGKEFIADYGYSGSGAGLTSTSSNAGNVNETRPINMYQMRCIKY